MANQTSTNTDTPSFVVRQPTTDRGPLFVDVCGIAMFLPEVSKVAVVDARKPRKAVTDGSLITPHMPLVGIKAGTYEPPVTVSKIPVDPNAKTPPPKETVGHVSFDYDIDALGKPIRFDAFVLDGHRVSFGGVRAPDGKPRSGGKAFGSMRLLAPDLELCSAVRTGGWSREVVGMIDFSNAFSVDGRAHGLHPGPLTFGHNIVDCADMAIATFEVGEKDTPCVRFEKGDQVTTIELKGNGPWRVMVGNFPVDELVGNNETVLRHDVPLTHLELYYELYHMHPFDPIVVPRGDNHVHVGTRTATGRCGPTLTP